MKRNVVRETQCTHTYLLFVRGFYDDTSLRRLHKNSKDFFGIGKISDSPLKADLRVFPHKNWLLQQSTKKQNIFYPSDVTFPNVIKAIKNSSSSNVMLKTHIYTVLLDPVGVQRSIRACDWFPNLDLPLALSSNCAFTSPLSN